MQTLTFHADVLKDQLEIVNKDMGDLINEYKKGSVTTHQFEIALKYLTKAKNMLTRLESYAYKVEATK